MMNLPYDVLLEKISKSSGETKEQIEAKVNEKLDALSGLISKEGALQIIANDLGIKVLQEDFSKVSVRQLRPGMRNVNISLKILESFDTRHFESNGRKGKVKALSAGDETGFTRLVFWNNKADDAEKIRKGDIVSVKNVYTRGNGTVEVHANDNTVIEINPEGISIDLRDSSAERKRMSEITRDDNNVEVFGTIVQVFEPYFFEACDECNRKLKQKDGHYECDQHGQKQPVYRGILTLYVDDGTKAQRAVLFDDQFKKLAQTEDLEAIRTQDSAREELKKSLLGAFITIGARVRYSEQYDRLDLNVSSFDLNPDPEEELKKLEEEQAQS